VHLDTYANSATAIAGILGSCGRTGLMLACRPTGSATLTLAAAGFRADVIFDTGTGNITHERERHRVVFQRQLLVGLRAGGRSGHPQQLRHPGEQHQRHGIDGDRRLCWHSAPATSTRLARAGPTASSGMTYDRLIYQAP